MNNQNESFQKIFEQTIVGIAQISPDGRVALVNDRFCEIVGRSRHDLLNLSMQKITHPDDVSESEKLIRRLVDSGKSFEIEKRYLKPDGSFVWCRNNVSLVKDETGMPAFVVAVVLDITREKAEQEEKEIVARRNKFLSEVSMALNSSLDFKETLHKITRLAVPDFGDWCYIHLADKQGEMELSDYWSRDPEKMAPLKEFASLVTTVGQSLNAVVTVFRTGNGVMRNGITDEYYQKVSASPRQLELFRIMHPNSVIVVPLKSLGKLLGTITISYSQVRSYNTEEFELLEEIAIRAGLALDNARLYSESKKAIISRDEFVSVASHELKTPLTSLMLKNQIALRRIQKGDESLTVDYWKLLLNEYEVHISRMSRLVEDMLDITRIQLGSYQLNISEADLRDSIKTVSDHLGPQLQSAACPLGICLDGDLSGKFDVLRIQQVMTNILTNAMKYAPGAPVNLDARGTQDRINIVITDKGKGIEKENLQRIFERFERAISPSSVSGLGLGLYISSRIIEAHSGRIWAESTIGEGTSIHIELPRFPAS